MEDAPRADVEAAQELKVKANQAYGSKRFEEAIRLYTEAQALIPSEPVYLSNRAAAHFETGDYAASLDDDSTALALLQAQEAQGADEAKGLRLKEKVLNRMRRAALQRKDWGLCIGFCKQLDEVEARLEKEPEHMVGTKTRQLLKALGFVSAQCTDHEALDSATGGMAALPLSSSESLPITRASLSSDFGYFPVGHEKPNGLIGMFGMVGKGGVEPIPVSELAERGPNGEWPGKLSLRLLFGACGDPRHIMQSFLELESHLSCYPTSQGSSSRRGRRASEAKMWAGVTLLCDMNDQDTRILARNVLLLVMLRGMGRQAGGSEDGGAVLDNLRWQMRLIERAANDEDITDLKDQLKKRYPDMGPSFYQKFPWGTHFMEQDVASAELLYKVWLSCNLTASESAELSEILESLVKVSSSEATWKKHPQYAWIEFQSQEDLAAVRKLWQTWGTIGRTKGVEFGKAKLRQIVASLKEGAPEFVTPSEEVTEAARVEMESWRRTGLTASFADIRRGHIGLGAMVVNPTLLHEVTPTGDIVDKPSANLSCNSSPDQFYHEDGVFRLVPILTVLPEALKGVVGMTCLQFYVWAQALSRLMSRGSDVRVCVLPGSICVLSSDLENGPTCSSGRAAPEKPLSSLVGYDRIHTTNIIDYVGPLNLLTMVGSMLDTRQPHAAMKADVLLNLGLYLQPGGFNLDLWLQRELLLSSKELVDFLGYTAKRSGDSLAELTYFVPSKLGPNRQPAGSAKLVKWLETTLAHIALPPVSECPPVMGSQKHLLEPRGYTIVTFVNLLRILVALKRVSPHWVAEHIEYLLQSTTQLWHMELVVAISLSLPSLPFFPASPTLLSLGSLSQHTLSVHLFPQALEGPCTGNPQLALVVIMPEGEVGKAHQIYKHLSSLSSASGESLRTRLIGLRGTAHLFSSLHVGKPDKQRVIKVALWLPKRWISTGAGKASVMRIDTYTFMSNFLDLRAP